jgi:cell volume regulation protein A
VVSVVVVAAVAARQLLGLGWREVLLLGAVLAPTHAAAVFSVLRRLSLPPRLAGMLEDFWVGVACVSRSAGAPVAVR